MEKDLEVGITAEYDWSELDVEIDESIAAELDAINEFESKWTIPINGIKW